MSVGIGQQEMSQVSKTFCTRILWLLLTKYSYATINLATRHTITGSNVLLTLVITDGILLNGSQLSKMEMYIPDMPLP